MAVSPANRDHVFAAGYNGIFYRSTNAGASWTLLNSGLTNVYYIYDIAPHPQNTNIIYLGTYNGVYKTTNAGTSWTRMGTLTNVNDVLIHPRGPDTVYAGANAGFYKSTDAGATWIQQNGGLVDVYVTSLAMNTGGRDSSFIFCGTQGGGFHRMYLSIIPINEQKSVTAALGMTCLPNPGRDLIQFNYALSQPTRVTIEIYDAQGRRVAIVTDREQAMGQHQVGWDCQKNAAGVYFARISTNTVCEVQKLILTR